jgi:hypothetical protein
MKGDVMRLQTVAIIGLAIGLFACGTTGGGTSTKTARRSHDHLYYNEIQTSAATNAYDLIRTLRPLWLRSRGQKSFRNRAAAYPMIYVNGDRYGGIDSLPSLSVANITEIQFLGASDATIRYGLDHAGGAILITLN